MSPDGYRGGQRIGGTLPLRNSSRSLAAALVDDMLPKVQLRTTVSPPPPVQPQPLLGMLAHPAFIPPQLFQDTPVRECIRKFRLNV